MENKMWGPPWHREPQMERCIWRNPPCKLHVKVWEVDKKNAPLHWGMCAHVIWYRGREKGICPQPQLSSSNSEQIPHERMYPLTKTFPAYYSLYCFLEAAGQQSCPISFYTGWAFIHGHITTCTSIFCLNKFLRITAWNDIIFTNTGHTTPRKTH